MASAIDQCSTLATRPNPYGPLRAGNRVVDAIVGVCTHRRRRAEAVPRYDVVGVAMYQA